jgi:DNA-binding MarR family transcriptional regulator
LHAARIARENIIPIATIVKMLDSVTFDLDKFSPYLVNVLASRLSRNLAAIYGDKFNISIAEWRIMSHLKQNRKVSIREIYRRVDMGKSRVSRAAQRLEDYGLLDKKPNPGDRRLVELSLTRAGLRLFDQIAPVVLGFEDSVFDVLTPDEKLKFTELVQRLNKAFEDNDDWQT